MRSTSTPYCNSRVGSDFLLLLKFSRISTCAENDEESAEEHSQILTALNSYAHSASPQINAILPLVFHKSATSGLRDLLHPETLKILRNRTFRLIANELAQRQCLINIINLFEKHDIPIILLKGAAFAGSLYPVNTPRLGVDIDLLVTTKQFDQACTLLSETMSPILLDAKRIATHEALFERVFVPKDKASPVVEIHRDLTNPFIFNIEENFLWQTSTKHPAFGSNLVRILSPEYTLLHLAVHAFRDLNFCNHNLLDAHEVWCQWKPDEKNLEEQASRWGAKKVLYCLLANCRSVMGTTVSEKLLKSLKPARINELLLKRLLVSSRLQNKKNPQFPYRLIQLISQFAFPDNALRGAAFQISYSRTRINDWLKTKKHKQS